MHEQNKNTMHVFQWTYGIFQTGSQDLKRESRGFSDFNYTRNRILWATRDNPSVRGIPKSNNEIKEQRKKRGTYKQKEITQNITIIK